jgi:hypothetical protein
LNSAEVAVYGNSVNDFKVGLIGPEYDGFGTKVAWPSGLNALSFQGPSTICHKGLLA